MSEELRKKLDLSSYKILGNGNIKNKFFIKSMSASKAAREKIKKSGGEIFIKNNADNKEI